MSTQYLVIVESPAKAKTIRKFLGKQYTVKASNGHVRDLPKSKLGIDIENHFEPKYITIKGKGDVIKELKDAAKKSSKIFLATDPDREGEAISWHLANLLNIEPQKSCRVTFNEITKNAIKKAITNPRSVDMNLVYAQQARRELDRLVGYKLSPLLWKKLKSGLSAGRVQSVAVRIICDREEEIQNFKAEEYWSISAKLAKYEVPNKVFEAKFVGTLERKIELKNKEQVDKIISAVDGRNFIVHKIKKAEKKRASLPPFTTSTLQQEASRKLGFTIKKTMLIAQQLYEGVDIKNSPIGLLTYIRTDSVRISEEAQQSARDLISELYGKEYVPDTPRVFKNKSSSQDAHEAIRPTYVSMKPSDVESYLSRDQYKLYKLVWDRFVASQMQNAIYDTITVDVLSEGYLFRAYGSQIKFAGYMVLYKESKDDTTSKEENINNDIPALAEGEKLKLKAITPRQHFTQPPPRYSEASLVKALEEKGIGRPSTYAPIIATILARGYVEKEQKLFLPTELGKVVTDMMKKHFEDIVNIEFTANMEEQLDRVEDGNENWVDIMEDFYSKFSNTLAKAEGSMERIQIQDQVTDIVCDKCGRNMVIKMGKFGKFLACPAFPECRNTKPIVQEAGVNCPICGGKVLIKKSKKRRTYLGCENNPTCEFMQWGTPEKGNCPICGNFLIKVTNRGNANIKCSNKECTFTSRKADPKK